MVNRMVKIIIIGRRSNTLEYRIIHQILRSLRCLVIYPYPCIYILVGLPCFLEAYRNVNRHRRFGSCGTFCRSIARSIRRSSCRRPCSFRRRSRSILLYRISKLVIDLASFILRSLYSHIINYSEDNRRSKDCSEYIEQRISFFTTVSFFLFVHSMPHSFP